MSRTTSSAQISGAKKTTVQNHSAESVGTVTGLEPTKEIVRPPTYGASVNAEVPARRTVNTESGTARALRNSRAFRGALGSRIDCLLNLVRATTFLVQSIKLGAVARGPLSSLLRLAAYAVYSLACRGWRAHQECRRGLLPRTLQRVVDRRPKQTPKTRAANNALAGASCIFAKLGVATAPRSLGGHPPGLDATVTL